MPATKSRPAAATLRDQIRFAIVVLSFFYYSNVSGGVALSMISSTALRECQESVAQARLGRQSGHVKGARERSLYIGSRGGATAFFLFGSCIIMLSCQVDCCVCQVFVCIWIHPERLWARGFQLHRHDLEGRVGMSRGREERSLHTRNRG